MAEDDWCIKPLRSHSSHHLDPFGSDPFRESDPFKGTSSEDFFKRTDKADLFGSSDPFGRKPTPPAKVLITFSIYHENVLFCSVWLQGLISIHILWPYPYFWSAPLNWATMVRALYLKQGHGTWLSISMWHHQQYRWWCHICSPWKGFSICSFSIVPSVLYLNLFF